MASVTLAKKHITLAMETVIDMHYFVNCSGTRISCTNLCGVIQVVTCVITRIYYVSPHSLSMVNLVYCWGNICCVILQLTMLILIYFLWPCNIWYLGRWCFWKCNIQNTLMPVIHTQYLQMIFLVNCELDVIFDNVSSKCETHRSWFNNQMLQVLNDVKRIEFWISEI